MARRDDQAAKEGALPVPAGERHLSIVGNANRDVARYDAPGSAGPRGQQNHAVIVRRVSRAWLVASLFLVVALPVLTAWFFLTEVASNRYTTEFRVAVRSTEAPVMSGMGEMLGLPGSSSTSHDAQALVQFLQSRAIISDLKRDVDVSAIYGREDIDWFSRLPAGAPIERVVARWKDFVHVRFEGANNTVVVSVVAFRPEDALDISTALLRHSDDFIGKLSDVARQDAVAFSHKEVVAAESRLTEARVALAAIQDREALLDPEASASAALALAAKVREQIVEQRAKLETQRAQLGPNTWPVRATMDHIAGLEAELTRLEAETTASKSASADDDRPLSVVLREYQAVSDELGFAERAYESALANYDAARLDADRRQIFLATVVPPGLPEEASFPKPARGVALTLAVALAIWLIGLIGFFAIRDHL